MLIARIMVVLGLVAFHASSTDLSSTASRAVEYTDTQPHGPSALVDIPISRVKLIRLQRAGIHGNHRARECERWQPQPECPALIQEPPPVVDGRRSSRTCSILRSTEADHTVGTRRRQFAETAARGRRTGRNKNRGRWTSLSSIIDAPMSRDPINRYPKFIATSIQILPRSYKYRATDSRRRVCQGALTTLRFEHAGTTRFVLRRELQSLKVTCSAPQRPGKGRARGGETAYARRPADDRAVEPFHAVGEGRTPPASRLPVEVEQLVFAHAETIRKPRSYDGKVVYEGESA